MAADPERSQRGAALLVGTALTLMVLAWILATPRSAGPDEPSHNVRAGALVRGELDGERLADSVFEEGFEIPAHIGFPDPGCYAFAADVPARCASELELPRGDELRGTRSADYPIWGHLLPGLGTFAPASSAAWAARLLDALVPLGLLTATLLVAAQRRTLGVGAALLAVTPMAWFMFAVVNPSGLVIAGGIGLWAALLAAEPDRRVARWLTAASWAALVLPRRDGLVWAVLVLSLAMLITGDAPRALWSRLGRWPQATVAAATLTTLVWAIGSDTNASRALLVTPLVPVAVIAARTAWRRWSSAPGAVRTRGASVGVAVVVAALAVVCAIVAVGRLSDARQGFLRLVIGSTGDDIIEAIGMLGWLDTPVPTTALLLWFLACGVLAGATVVAGCRTLLAGAAAIVLTAIVMSWLLTMVQTDDTANYWQGRYYLPLLVGIPMVFARAELATDAARRVGISVLAAAVVVVNVALAAMMRRFGVGISGSLLPWDWDTYRAPVPLILLLAVHIGASIVLVGWGWTLGTSNDRPTNADGDATARLVSAAGSRPRGRRSTTSD